MPIAAHMQQPKRSDWTPHRRLHLSSIRRTRDDPFEREADANARIARQEQTAPTAPAGVRLHHDAASAEAAYAIGAHAFTVGDDVYFGRGEYQPGTVEGRALMAHEVTHVAQQRRDPGAPALQGSWWEGAGAIVGGIAGAIVGGVLGGVGGAIGLGLFGALAGAFVGMGLKALFGSDDSIDRAEPEDKGLAEQDPKFQEQFQKNLKEGMDKLAQSSCAFPAGANWKYDDRYWKRVNDPKYIAYEPKGVSPAKAVDELTNNLDLWEFDCAIYPEVIWLYAYRKTLGAANFNTKFKDLRLRQHETKGINEEFYDSETMSTAEFDKKWDDAPAGSKVMWTNKSSVTEGTAWHNENGIKRTKGSTPDEARYDAHPLGSNLSEREVKFGLGKAATDWPTASAAQETYVSNKIYRHQLHLLHV